ncbi:hypothetical protein K458DRAFT_387815 [Lentithecium fluviatile CBS 122367]|uniref:Uncharacterized protein n=1 Tax=Lentithecium fluviatile CBS 122367 TaxID=1168545 RepID=A0A6G1J6M0_9PLEO|nr:hypothetical protein K458DRAFT_387815 [Lentithecium fluviatile CBS 122367]
MGEDAQGHIRGLFLWLTPRIAILDSGRAWSRDGAWVASSVDRDGTAIGPLAPAPDYAEKKNGASPLRTCQLLVRDATQVVTGDAARLLSTHASWWKRRKQASSRRWPPPPPQRGVSLETMGCSAAGRLQEDGTDREGDLVTVETYRRKLQISARATAG